VGEQKRRRQFAAAASGHGPAHYDCGPASYSSTNSHSAASCGATSCCPEANGSRCHRSPTASCLPKRGATTASNGSTKCQSGRIIDPRLPSAEWSASSVGAAAATVYGERSTAAGASAAELFRGGSGSGTVGCGAKQLAVESRAGRAAVEAHLQSQRI